MNKHKNKNSRTIEAVTMVDILATYRWWLKEERGEEFAQLTIPNGNGIGLEVRDYRPWTIRLVGEKKKVGDLPFISTALALAMKEPAKVIIKDRGFKEFEEKAYVELHPTDVKRPITLFSILKFSKNWGEKGLSVRENNSWWRWQSNKFSLPIVNMAALTDSSHRLIVEQYQGGKLTTVVCGKEVTYLTK